MTSPTEIERSTPSASGLEALTIESIEVTPIVVPLAQEYRGSYYHMTNRATVVTRVVTREGIVGEAYAGDEDSTLLQIAAVITDEIAPRLIGEDGFAIERCWELGFPVTFDQLRDRSSGAATTTRSRSTSSAATTAVTWPASATRSPNGSSAASAAASSRSADGSLARTQNGSPRPATRPAASS